MTATSQQPTASTPPTRPGSAPPTGVGAGQAAGVLSRRQIMWVFVGLMLGIFLAALDQMIVSVAIRTIADDLHGLNLQAWATTAYLITATISTPLYGKLSDLYGRKPFFLAAIMIFIVGSIACTFATSMYFLAAFRAFQGLGAGGLMSLALAIIGDVVPPRQRAKYQGYFLAVFGTASVLGPVIGGFLAGQSQILYIAGWRWVFLVNVPIAAIALVVVAKVLNIPHTRRDHRIDWWGAITISIGLVPLLIIAEQGQSWGWHSSRAWICYVVGGVGLLLFVIVEHLMRDDALIPLRLFRGGVFSITSLAGVLIGMAMFGGMSVVPLYLQIVKGASPTKAGLLILPMVLGIMLASIFSGQLIARTGRYKGFPILGTLLMAVGLLLLTGINADTPLSRTDIWMFIFGLGLGNCMQPLIIAVQNAVPARDMGVATASATFFRQMGGTLGTAVFLSILFSLLPDKMSGAFARIVPTAPFQAALHDPAVLANPHNQPVLQLIQQPAAGSGGVSASVLQDSSFIQQLDSRLAQPFLVGFSDSMRPVFLTAAVVIGVACVLLWFMREIPLRNQSGIQARMAEAGEGPALAEPLAEPLAELAAPAAELIAPKVEQKVERNAERNGVDPRLVAGNGHPPTNSTHGDRGEFLMSSVSEGFVAPQAGTPPIHGHVRRSDGAAVHGAALTLIDPNGLQVGRNVSDGNGEYQVAAPGPGSYVLIASAGGHQPQASTVTIGAGPAVVDVVLAGTGGLAGTVLAAGKDTPITGALITLADERGEVVGSAHTGPDGHYRFGELPAGEYTVVVSAEPFRPTALAVSVSGTAQQVLDVELIGGARLRGQARAGDGRTVPDARITLLDRAGNVVGVTTTDDLGEYSFSDLPEGEYTVIASGYPPVASALRVNGGEHGAHDVRLGHPDV
ncbi:MAG TPA: MFS transporter [Pseudonocardiaceae bacterium]|nr:MFS transporter [Pseudonocardiaceae bacterium]